ncbi:MAG: hypothetical protein V3V08_07000 [Nannocystaceae bacterium]
MEAFLAAPLTAAVVCLVLGAVASVGDQWHRAIAHCGLILAAAAGGTLTFDPTYDPGVVRLGGAWESDHLAGLFDLMITCCAAVVLALRPRCSPIALLLGVTGGFAVVHASDLVAVYLGLELASVGLVATIFTSTRSAGRRYAACWVTAFQSLFVLLGVVLVYGGVSSTQVRRLGSLTASVFTHWGAVQKYVDSVESGLALPAGLLQQFEGKIVTGMAPVAWFLPGILILLAALLLKAGLFPSERAFGGGAAEAPAVALYRGTILRFASLAAFMRIFVEALSGPRMLFPPYGWTMAAQWLSLAGLVFAAISTFRCRHVQSAMTAAVAAYTSMFVWVLAEAVRGGVGGFPSALEARHRADLMVAGAVWGLVVVTMALVGSAALSGSVGGRPSASFAAMRGRVRGDRMLSASTAVFMTAMICAPLIALQGCQGVSPAFDPPIATWRWLALPLWAGWGVIVVGQVRIGRCLFAAPLAARQARGASPTLRAIVGVAALGIVAVGCLGAAFPRSLVAVTSGMAYPVGTDARRDAVRATRVVD